MTVSRRIEDIREELDGLTEELVRLIAKRDELVMQIREEKKRPGLPVLDLKREKDEIKRAEKVALRENVDPELVRELLEIIIKHSREVQK